MKTPKPEPTTCAEAADRLASKYEGHYDAHARHVRDIAFILKAFGETPVPKPILDRYEWSGI